MPGSSARRLFVRAASAVVGREYPCAARSSAAASRPWPQARSGIGDKGGKTEHLASSRLAGLRAFEAAVPCLGDRSSGPSRWGEVVIWPLGRADLEGLRIPWWVWPATEQKHLGRPVHCMEPRGRNQCISDRIKRGVAG